MIEEVLLLAPPLEEHARTLRALVGLGAALGSRGARVEHWPPPLERLDRTEDLAFSSLDGSIAAAAGRFGSGQPALVGLRFGGYLALRAVMERRAPRTVLWEPVTDPRQYLREIVRVALANQLTTYGGNVRFNADTLLANARRDGYLLVDGYQLSAASLDDLEKAPEITPEHAAAFRDSLSLVFWRNKRGCERWQERGFDAVFLPGVRLAWDSIRYVDADPASLIGHTAERLQR
jgi:hypothetical protein